MEEERSIAVIVDETPDLVLVNSEVRGKLIRHVTMEISLFKGDITTVSGRKEIASFAHKIARTKTAIDNAGKALNEKARAQINAVDAIRREIKEKFDAMRDAVRAPLTEWEVAEQQRLECRDNTMRIINQAGIGIPGETSEAIAARLQELECIYIFEDVFKEGTDAAVEALAQARAQVRLLLDRAKSEEAARAELEKLRAEAAAREKADREREEAKAAAEKFRLKKEQQAKAEAERIRVAELRAVAEAEAKHKPELQAVQLKLAQQERDAAEAARRKAEEEKAAKAEEARRRNDAHLREKAKSIAVKALVAAGLDVLDAALAFEAIEAGKIPHIQIVW